MDNNSNEQLSHLLGLAGSHFALGKKVQKLERLLARITGQGSLITRNGYSDECLTRKRTRDGESDIGSSMSDDIPPKLNKKHKLKNSESVLTPEASVRYNSLLEDWISDDDSWIFLTRYLDTLFQREEKDDDNNDDDDDDLDRRGEQLTRYYQQMTNEQHVQLYIAMLERTAKQTGTAIAVMEKQVGEADKNAYMRNLYAESEESLNTAKSKVILDMEILYKQQTENNARLQRAVTRLEDTNHALRKELTECKEGKKTSLREIETLRASKIRKIESHNAEIQRYEDGILETQMKHMDEMNILNRKHEERVVRHDTQAKTHCEAEINKWRQKADGAYHIAKHTACVHMEGVRKMLTESIFLIKKELEESSIEIPEALMQLLDNAPLQFSLVAGLNFMPVHVTPQTPSRAPLPIRNGNNNNNNNNNNNDNNRGNTPHRTQRNRRGSKSRGNRGNDGDDVGGFG